MTDALTISYELLQQLTRSAPDENKHAAFARLLALDRGWWGTGSLRDFAQAATLAAARRRSAGSIDWRSIADEVLMRLFSAAGSINTDPRQWLLDLADRLVAEETRSRHDVSLGERRGPAATLAHFDRIIGTISHLADAIRRLPDEDRIVVYYYVFEQYSRADISRLLEITLAELAERLERIRRAPGMADDGQE